MSRNPFLDLGFSREEATAQHIRSQLAATLEQHIERKGWSQTDAARTLNQKIAALPTRRRTKVKARAVELIAEELSLQDLRKAMNRTQVELAKTLNVGQDTVSRYEQRTDMLSTLQE